MSYIQIENQKSKIGNPLAIRLCSIYELPFDIGKSFRVMGHAIAVFKTRSGNLLAVQNRCPHKGGPLADGILAGNRIVCPFHAFRYDLATGQCDQPNTCPIQTYEVFTQGADVYLKLPSS